MINDNNLKNAVAALADEIVEEVRSTIEPYVREYEFLTDYDMRKDLNHSSLVIREYIMGMFKQHNSNTRINVIESIEKDLADILYEANGTASGIYDIMEYLQKNIFTPKTL